MAPVEHLVADASAFLRGAPLQEIGRRVYTTREVLAEIRDRAARRRLAGLPFELLLRQPFPEHVRLVSEFSKRTGDFRSLSAADIQVLALTLQLEAEHGGGRPLRTEPRPQVQLSLTNRHPEAPVDVPGFHVPSKTKCPGNEKIPLVAEGDPGDPVALAETEFSSFLFWRNPLPSIEEDLEAMLKADPLLLGAEDPEDQESDEEDGWITPRNIEQMQQSTCWGSEPAKVQVGCITTDFAMQNVLLQMGLHVLAFNGLLIQHARSYILRCHGCFRTTSKMTRLFCPHCGNKTLKKVAVTVKDDGSFHLHFSQNPKVLNPRGLRVSLPHPGGLLQPALSPLVEAASAPARLPSTTPPPEKCWAGSHQATLGSHSLLHQPQAIELVGQIKAAQPPAAQGRPWPPGGNSLPGLSPQHSLPAPQGGKHASNPHLTEDQRFPQQRLSRKARQKTNAFDPDYLAGVSPFAEHDIHSRAANLQIRDVALGAGRRRLNPNMSRKKCLKNK